MDRSKVIKITLVLLFIILLFLCIIQYIMIKEHQFKMKQIYAYDLWQLTVSIELYAETFSVNPEAFSKNERDIFKQNLKSNFMMYNSVTYNISRNHREVLPENYKNGTSVLPHFSEIIYLVNKKDNWDNDSFEKMSKLFKKAATELNELVNNYHIDDLYSNEFKEDFEQYIEKFNTEFKSIYKTLPH